MVSRKCPLLCLIALSTPLAAHAQPVWSGYAGNAQHTANSTVASQALQQIIWSTAVDLDPQYAGGPGGNLYAHYGSPLVTSNNVSSG